MPSCVAVAGAEREPPLPGDLEAPLLHEASHPRLGRAGLGGALHLGGPEEVEVLADVVAPSLGRQGEAPRHADCDRAELRRDGGEQEERPDAERRMRVRGEEHLRADGAGRAGEDERRDHRRVGEHPSTPRPMAHEGRILPR